VEVEDEANGFAAWSNPIRCTATESPLKHYWGMIHAHTEHSDGIATVDHYFTYLREHNALDFGALADHDHLYETSEAMWARAQEATRRYHEPGRFVTFLGYEWAKWRQNGDGDRNVYYLEDDRPMFRSDDGEYPTPGALFAALRSEIALVVPHHPANRGNHCDWKDSDPQIERLVEIFSEWGSSECSVNDGNPYAMKTLAETPEQLDSGEVAAGFVQTALALGRRIGFTAGGDDHQGHPGDLTLRPGSPPRASGLMAVRATTRTREAIWKALHDRHCYGTTGARIIVDFAVDGAPMGSELWLDEQPALAQGRTLEVAAHGTADFAKIEIVRNNQVVHTHCPAAPDASFAWEDTLPFEAIALPPALHWPTPFCFYYLRLTQTDGEMAWVSPVWVSAKP